MRPRLQRRVELEPRPLPQQMVELGVVNAARAVLVERVEQTVHLAQRDVSPQAQCQQTLPKLLLAHGPCAVVVPITKEIDHTHQVGCQQLSQLNLHALARRRVERHPHCKRGTPLAPGFSPQVDLVLNSRRLAGP